MIRSSLIAALCGVAVLAPGCAAIRPAQRVAVDYNRAFAQSRDEILLLNIVRAASREPLQFSTMGNVTGTGRAGGSITSSLANLIGGGTNPFTVSPGLTLTEAHPSLTIIPLSSKEFTEGILRPITPQVLNYFLGQGWDPEFLLPLVVAGVRCSGQRNVLNGADYTTNDYYRFADMFSVASAKGFRLEQQPKGTPVQIQMESKDALATLQAGVGPNRRARLVRAEQAKAVVEIQEFEWAAPNLDLRYVCEQDDNKRREIAAQPRSQTVVFSNADDGAPSTDEPVLMLRSVEAIIYYLGEGQRARLKRERGRCAGERLAPLPHPEYPTYRTALRDQSGGIAHDEDGRPTGEEKILFRLDLACSGLVPDNAAVRTRLHRETLFIPIARVAPGDDRTLKTFSFLSELIALQTNQSLIESASPTIAIQR